MSTRLTKDIRDAVSLAVLKHRFGPTVQTHNEAVAAFANEVYDDVYKKTVRAEMDNLPSGWLYEAEGVRAQFGTSFQRIQFNGRGSGELSKFDSRKSDVKTRRVTEKHRGSCMKVYDATHRLTLRFEAIHNAGNDLTKSIEEARRSVDAALASATTIKRLIETWPEIAPFARAFDCEKPQLPALPTAELNAILELPVSEAA